jgi:hypothetical protein
MSKYLNDSGENLQLSQNTPLYIPYQKHHKKLYIKNIV